MTAVGALARDWATKSTWLAAPPPRTTTELGWLPAGPTALFGAARSGRAFHG